MKLPFASTRAVKVWVFPALSVTEIDTTSPWARSVLPVIVGVLSLSEPSASSEITGATVSTAPLLSLTVALFPFSSVAVADTVYSPSAREVGTSAVKLPLPSTRAVKF